MDPRPPDPTDAEIAYENGKSADAIERLTPLVDPDDMPQVQTIVRETIAAITTHHSGPLPRASELGAYNQIDAGFAERIVRMAEKEQAHRHALPREILDREYALKTRGQNYAVAITVVVLLFCALLAYLGDTDMAGKVAIGTLVGLVGVFVSGRAIDALAERRQTDDEDED